MRKQLHYGDPAWLRGLHWALALLSRLYGWLLQASLVWQYRCVPAPALSSVQACGLQ